MYYMYVYNVLHYDVYILQCTSRGGEHAYTPSVGEGQTMYNPPGLFTPNQPSPLGCFFRWGSLLASLARSSGLSAAGGWQPNFLLLLWAGGADSAEEALVCLI